MGNALGQPNSDGHGRAKKHRDVLYGLRGIVSRPWDENAFA